MGRNEHIHHDELRPTLGLYEMKLAGTFAAAGYAQYNVVYLSTLGTSGQATFTRADADALTTADTPLFLVHTASPNTQPGEARVVRTGLAGGLNTAASAVNAPVFLSSTAGGVTLTAPTTGVPIIVGRVRLVAATGPTWYFDPAGEAKPAFRTAMVQSAGVRVQYAGGIIIVEFTSTAGTTDYDAVLVAKARLVSTQGYMIGAGAAADTVKLTKVGAGDITDTHDVSALADQDKFDFDTINDANIDIAAAGTLRCTTASDALVKVVATLIQVA